MSRVFLNYANAASFLDYQIVFRAKHELTSFPQCHRSSAQGPIIFDAWYVIMYASDLIDNICLSAKTFDPNLKDSHSVVPTECSRLTALHRTDLDGPRARRANYVHRESFGYRENLRDLHFRSQTQPNAARLLLDRRYGMSCG